MDFDRGRATQVGSLQSQQQATAGGQMVFCDSQAALPDEHWIVDNCEFEAFDPTGAAGVANTFFSGLFLCPPGTVAPVANGTRFNMIALPTDGGGQIVSGSNVAQGNSMRVIKSFVVPPGWFVRAIWNNRAANVFGAGSLLQLNLTYTREKQC